MPRLEASRIAVVGDLHGAWAPFDAAYFAASDYDLVLFVGDLAGGSAERDQAVAKSLARIGKPSLMLLGNNDVQALSVIESELAPQRSRVSLPDCGRAVVTTTCGYSNHELLVAGRPLTLVAARPFAMGGGKLSFPGLLSERHGIETMTESTHRLCRLVDHAESEELLFLAHNGPEGLGHDPYALWGNDFDEEGGDWGDPDLRDAIAHARRIGKRVHAVIAGHMHRRVRGGGERPLTHTRGDVLYVNPAQVPRIVPSGEGALHHHVSLTWKGGAACVQEHWVSNGDV